MPSAPAPAALPAPAPSHRGTSPGRPVPLETALRCHHRLGLRLAPPQGLKYRMWRGQGSPPDRLLKRGNQLLGVVRADQASRWIPIAKRDAMNYRVIPVWPRE
jgi:hypothetical protein